MNKNLVFSKLCLGIALLGFAGCSDDEVSWPEVDGAAPVMELKSDHIRTEQGYSITVKGNLKDADGITAVTLSCPTLHLDKTIDIVGIYGKPLTEYKLDYTHKIHESVASINHQMVVTVTDVGGRQVSQTVLVTMDADFAAPTFTVAPGENLTVLIKDPTVLKIKYGIEDNKSLKYVRMLLIEGEVEPFNAADVNAPSEGDTTEDEATEGEETNADEEEEELSDAELEAKAEAELHAWEQHYSQYYIMEELNKTDFDSPSFTYENAYPVEDIDAVYTLVIRAEDGMYHAIDKVCKFNVQELPDFGEMFLADVETAEELNSDVFGVPILIDHVGTFQYEANYYNAKAGTQICFLPQDTDFTPICFAPSKEDPNALGDDIDEVNKFVLDQAGVYYHFEFNTFTREYSVSTYSIAEAHDPVENMTPGANHQNQWMAWGDAIGDAWWNTWNIGVETWINDMVAPLQRDKENPHIMRTEPFRLEPGGFSFIIANYHEHGWWGYTEWRADNSENPHRCQYLGMWIEDNVQFKGNAAYFNQKYGDVPGFTREKWNDQAGYKNNFVTDSWFQPNIKKRGNYIFEVDFHTEACRLVPAN